MNAISSDHDRLGTLLSWDPMLMLRWMPAGGQLVETASTAPMHVEMTADGAMLTVDMPGVRPEDLEVTFETGTLAIAGKRGDRTYRYHVELGNAFDPDRFEAQLEHGVLTVHATRRPEAKPRKITVNTARKALVASDAA
jgi:HSP20 family protein